jgi:hypothetical protein
MNPPGWGFDPSGDFLLADGVERIDLFRQASDGVYQVPQAGHGIWENPTMKNTAGVVGVDRVWHLHGPDHAGSLVLPGDILRAQDGSQWVVQRADVTGVQDELTLQTTRAVGSPAA